MRERTIDLIMSATILVCLVSIVIVTMLAIADYNRRQCIHVPPKVENPNE